MNPEDYEEQFVGPKQFKKKNTKKWCRGKKGVEHQPVVEIDQKRLFGQELECRFVKSNGRYLICYHHEVCTVCGKVLRDYLTKCPTTGQKTGYQR